MQGNGRTVVDSTHRILFHQATPHSRTASQPTRAPAESGDVFSVAAKTRRANRPSRPATEPPLPNCILAVDILVGYGVKTGNPRPDIRGRFCARRPTFGA